MVSNNTNKLKKTSGFTIVELLIVIVVIGILAAITIVAYNGVQSKAKTTSAQAAANSVIKKAELFNADDTAPTSGYPANIGQLTTGATGKTYELTGVSAAGTALTTATTSPVPGSPNQVTYAVCGGAGATGSSVIYYDYAQKKGVQVTSGTCP